MERYLLFDSSCMTCSSLARRVEWESQGWLRARSLADPDIQVILNQINPEWRWEPMLMEKEDEDVHVYAGIALRLKILFGLGPQRTWHIIQIIGSRRRPVNTTNASRRHILKGGLALFGALALGSGWEQFFGNVNAHADSSSLLDKPKGLPIHLPSNHPDIALLKETHVVQTVTRSFGPLSWDDVYKIEFTNSSKPGYIILLEKSVEMSLTFLALSDITSSKLDAGLVGRLKKKTETNTFVDWFLIDGRSLSDTAQTIQEKRSSRTESLEPDIDYSCIIPCMDQCLKENLIGNCAESCLNCVVDIASGQGFFNFDCLSCTFCAGGSAIACARDCATYCSEIV